MAFWNKKKEEKKPRSKAMEWVDALKFAIIVATLLKWGLLSAFTIPTPSMEGSLLVGDYLFVSKIHYGPRTPITPLQVPLTHQLIPGLNIKSYTDLIQLPSFRLPGFRDVRRNESVVFNYPGYPDQRDEDHPVDLKTYYVKRCVGIPGDTLQIVQSELMVNGEKSPVPANIQWSYHVKCNNSISDQNFLRNGIWDVKPVGTDYFVYASDESIQKLTQIPGVTANKASLVQTAEGNFLRSWLPGEGQTDILPNGQTMSWNQDNFGPLYLPAEGNTMKVDADFVMRYGYLVEFYEGHKDVNITGDVLTIDGDAVKEYTFQQDYYFMMGDNRHNSLDSRFWGMVPEDHIMGKPLFVFMSLDANQKGFKKVRWRRMFSLID